MKAKPEGEGCPLAAVGQLPAPGTHRGSPDCRPGRRPGSRATGVRLLKAPPWGRCAGGIYLLQTELQVLCEGQWGPPQLASTPTDLEARVVI